jgi:hypothetical protein
MMKVVSTLDIVPGAKQNDLGVGPTRRASVRTSLTQSIRSGRRSKTGSIKDSMRISVKRGSVAVIAAIKNRKRGPSKGRSVESRRFSTMSAADVARLTAKRAETRGVDLQKIGGNKQQRAYFADVGLLRRFSVEAPELLLLPWELMRAMGVLHSREPARTDYTFFSHQCPQRDSTSQPPVPPRPAC